MRRRDFLKAAVAGGAGVTLSGRLYPRAAWAQGPIKIGMPAALSGAYAQYGIQAKRGAGALTAKSFHRYFFRVNTSGPMGARAVSLYLAESPMKRFFALGSDYAWGRDSVASFTSQITAAKKDIVPTEFPPVGTKDFASYIAKIRQSRADGVYLVLPGQDATIYLKQAHQFGLNREVKPIMEILELENM